MPGLIGYTDRHRRLGDRDIPSMMRMLDHCESSVADQVFSNGMIHASRIHLGLIKQGEQPYTLGQDHFWMEGEIYNREALADQYKVSSQTDIELIARIYHSMNSFSFLRDVDGYFTSVYYDGKSERIHLISDRYGFKPLYYTMLNGDLLWSSELKAFLGHPHFQPIIAPEAVRQFFSFGYLLENGTWFPGVELVPPSSVISFDPAAARMSHTRYWSWHDIPFQERALKIEDISEELEALFRVSVRKRAAGTKRIGLSLSGGLDSRAILAFFPSDGPAPHTFTFGRKGCPDIQIAQTVSGLRGANHHILEINADNWLQPRISGVWKSDGAVSLLHIHGTEFLLDYRKEIDFQLNGFAGDLVLGGSYMRPTHIDAPVDKDIVKKVTHSNSPVTEFDNWYFIPKTDPYFINNRVRRFTNAGLVILGKVVEPRMPFWDNALVEFAYSLPDTLRYKGRIYHHMLLRAFPAFFTKIPWQKTGLPIGFNDTLVAARFLFRRSTSFLGRHLHRFGFGFSDPMTFTDYPMWIRMEPAKSFFRNTLLNPNALYREFVNQGEISFKLRNHLQGKADYAEKLCLALTFEIWLQQLFEKKYRDGSTDYLLSTA
jgi:asparagine synthase (glutamine-hydrolysing)